MKDVEQVKIPTQKLFSPIKGMCNTFIDQWAFLFDLELGFYVIMGCDPPKFILIQQFVEAINL